MKDSSFSEAQLVAAGISDPTTLKFAFFNTATNTWELVNGNIVDTVSKVISQTTSHFSQWGVYSVGNNSSDGIS